MCNCITETDRQLKEYNTKLETPIMIDPESKDMRAALCAVVSTAKIDTRKRGAAMTLFAAFCPFCGERYENGKDKPPPAAPNAALENAVKSALAYLETEWRPVSLLEAISAAIAEAEAEAARSKVE